LVGNHSTLAHHANVRDSEIGDFAEPQIGEGTEVGELARVVGDVTIGHNSEISDRASIRADEGHPFVIGANANIEGWVTFHALEEASIEVGDDLTAGDDSVLHGPLVAGNGLTVGHARSCSGSSWRTA